jgi:hypothetical protein
MPEREDRASMRGLSQQRIGYSSGTTECRKPALSFTSATPDKVFSIFATLFRDQEVEGSNPFAPTIFHRSDPDT